MGSTAAALPVSARDRDLSQRTRGGMLACAEEKGGAQKPQCPTRDLGDTRTARDSVGYAVSTLGRPEETLLCASE